MSHIGYEIVDVKFSRSKVIENFLHTKVTKKTEESLKHDASLFLLRFFPLQFKNSVKTKPLDEFTFRQIDTLRRSGFSFEKFKEDWFGIHKI